jgi:hypothetical protein
MQLSERKKNELSGKNTAKPRLALSQVNSYWEDLASQISEQNVNVEFEYSTDPINKLPYARKLFQKGIVFLMVGKDELSQRNLKESDEKFAMIPERCWEPGDFIRKYFIEWILTETMLDDLLYKATARIELNLVDDVLRYEIAEIFEVYFNSVKPTLDQRIVQAGRNFKWSSDDKYLYETIADRMIELARIYLILRYFESSSLIVSGAQKLYDLALRKIPVMLAEENPRWADFTDKPDKMIEDMKSPGAGEYLARRELLRGSIPLYRRQGEVIDGLCKMPDFETGASGMDSFKKAGARLEEFFREIINPPDKASSRLGLVDELVWVFIKKRFSFQVLGKAYDGKPDEIIRRCLNGT